MCFRLYKESIYTEFLNLLLHDQLSGLASATGFTTCFNVNLKTQLEIKVSQLHYPLFELHSMQLKFDV